MGFSLLCYCMYDIYFVAIKIFDFDFDFDFETTLYRKCQDYD